MDDFKETKKLKKDIIASYQGNNDVLIKKVTTAMNINNVDKCGSWWCCGKSMLEKWP